MSWIHHALSKGVERGVRDAVERYCAPGGGLDEVIEQCVWKHFDKTLSRTNRLTRLGFTWALRLYFHKHGRTYKEASDLANSTLSEYLADEKIKFGDPAYAWTREGAEAVADEYELRFWERP